MNSRFLISAAALCVAPCLAYAQDARELPPIVAEQDESATALSRTELSGEALAAARASSPDAMATLRGQPGFSAFSNGGISALPSVRGMSDDRLLTTIDGAPATAFCPNHMNPASSYMLSGRLTRVTMIPTLSPVSAGGDNIGGVIALESAVPIFATPDQGLSVSGNVGAAYRSISRGWSGNVSATLAGEHASLGYDAAYAYGANYKDGAGDQVRSSAFESYDQAVTLGLRSDQGDLFTFKIGRAFAPYEGFPTQRMDMTENDSVFVNAAYERGFSWGDLRAAANWRSVDHEMNFLDDKLPGDMPMLSEGEDYGAQISVRNVSVSGVGSLSGGVELFFTELDDYWPPVSGSMMMGPDDYININDGERNRYALWGEWSASPSEHWTTTAGLRYERVEMDAGDVRPYGTGMMQIDDVNAAAAFNARSHAREDDNIDATLTALWRPNETSAYEFGFARKTRSPNLYERYTWGRGAMSSSMTSFAGDANAYVGNLDLEPEIAHSLAASAEFTSADGRDAIKVSAYHSWVTDYIDADYLQDLPLGMGGAMPTNTTFVQLQFANHDATLYGFEVSGHSELWSNAGFGVGVLSASLSYTHGTNEDTGDALYHIAPLTAFVSLEQSLGRWTNTLELELVDEKDRVNDLRHEPETGGYALAHLRTSAEFGNVRLDLGIENVFDTQYELPLGGVSYGDYRYEGGGARPLDPLAGPGRSFNIGLNVSF